MDPSFVLPESSDIWGFDPTTIGGCVLWLDGADANTLFSNTAGTTPSTVGGSVAFWKDKSVLANNATQATAGNQPTRASTGGINCVATSQTAGMFLNLATPANLPSGTANATYFTVTTFKYNADTGGGPRAIFSHGTNADSQARIIADRQTSTLFFSCTGGSSVPGANVTASNSTQSRHILSCTLNNLIGSIFYNGTPGNNTNVDQQTPSVPLNTVNSLASVGNTIIGGSGYGVYDGNISEILVFNTALSNSDRQTIEGYLAWKWGIQANLPTTHPYSPGVSSLSSIVPSNYANLALWLDAADSNTISFSSGTNVSEWRDKSGNGRNVSPTTNAFQYVSAFNGSYPTLSSSITGGSGRIGSVSSFTLPNPSTIFAVIQNRGLASGTSTFPYLFNVGTGGNRAYAYAYNQTTTPGFFRISTGTSGPGNADVPTDLNTTTAQVFTMDMGVSSTLLYTNGNLISTTTNSGAPVTSASLTIGGNGTNEQWTGHFCEFMIFTSDITTTQRQQIEGYLASKWGLQASLPAGHPYSTALVPSNPVYRPFLRNFVPTDISDCIMWFDGADLTSMFTDTDGTTAVTGNGSNVRHWRDKSGSGNNITTTVSGPTLTTSSNPCGFDMNHATGHLSKTDVVNNSRTYTKFLVFRRTNDPANPSNQFQRLFSYAKTFGDQRTTDPSGFHMQATGSQTGLQVMKAGSGSSSFTISTNTYYVVTIVANPLTMSLSLSGALTPTVSFTLPNTDFSGTTFRLGNSFTSFQLWPGFINEVISYNRELSVSEYREVEGYLAWKWGLRNSLPATHPFYRFPNPSLTPIQPELQLYKNTFDPSDLAPDIWFDPQDKSTIAVDSNNRVMQWLNKGTSATCSSFLYPEYSSRTLNTTETLSNAIGISGPLITTSTTGDGIGMDYLDFSGGGSFYISSVNISGTTAVITLGTAEVGTVTGGSISTFSIETGSGINTATLATIYFSSFALQNMIHPFAVGSTIRVSSTVSTGTTLNGDWVVFHCTPFYVQFQMIGATPGTITTQGTITSVTTPNIATVTYTTSSRTQKLLAGHTLSSITGMTPAGLNGTTPIIWNASPNCIRFLTSVATGTISAGGTITGPTVPHNIPAGAQVSIGLASGYEFSDRSSDSLYPIFNILPINLTVITSGLCTPYIVAAVTTNTITVNIPNTTSYPSGFPQGNMMFSAGRVDYGSIQMAGPNNQNVANTLRSTGNTSTSATINFTNFSRLRNNTFVAGDTVVISGVTNPTTYNGFWYVTGGTNTGLSGSVIIDTTTAGTLANMVSTAGTINRVSYSMPSGCLGIQSISVTGTTATVTYNNSTRRINLTQNGVPFRVGHYIYIARTTATGATPGIFNGTWVVTGQSTDTGGTGTSTTGTLTFTTAASAGTTAGTGILTRGSGGVGLTGAFPTTSGTITATSATVTFANQPIVPFIAGQQIFITGTTSSSTDINGTWTVLSSTNSSVTFTIVGAPGNLTVQGTLSAAVLVVTSGTYASPNLTLNFSPTLAVAPFAPNAMVSLFGVTPTANIGNWRVVSSTVSGVVLNVPTGSGPIAAPFTGTIAFALPLTRGTAVPHGLLSGYNIAEAVAGIYAYTTNGENSNGLNNLIYTIDAIPSVYTYQIFPFAQFYITPSASFIQATVGPSIRTDTFPPQVFYPLSAYCLENTRSQTSGGIFNGSNASMTIIPHGYTSSLQNSESVFCNPPALATSSIVNAISDAKGNIMFGYFYFNSAPRVLAWRQNVLTTSAEFYQNTISMPGDDSSFRMYTRSLNLTSSTVNDVGPQTDVVGMVGGRYDTGFLGLQSNGYNQVATVSAVVTNAVWAASVATLTIVTAGNVPIQPADTIQVAGIVNVGETPSGFNGSFVVSGTPTLTSVTYALATNPGGSYVPGTGTVVPTTSTLLTTGHIRLGARPNVTPSFTPGSYNFSHWLDIGISEIIAFNRILMTEERQLLEGYMAQKYGFQNNLGGRSTTTQFAPQSYRIGNLFSVGTVPPYTISMTISGSTNPLFLRTRVVVAGCTESPMVNGTWAVVSGANALATFVSQNAVPIPVLVGAPNRLVGSTGTVTLTGNSTTVEMSAAQNTVSGTVVNGAVYTVTVPSQTVTVSSTTSLTLASPPVFSAGTSISGITLSVNSVLVRGCTLTSGSNTVSCNTTAATTGTCPSTTNIMVLPTTTTTTTGTGVTSYVMVAPVTVISPILPSNTGAVPVLSGVSNPIVGGTGTVTLTGNTSSITGIASQSITLGTVVTGAVYSVTLNGLTASAITTTSLTLSSPPVFSGGTTLTGVSMFVGSTLVANCVLTSGSSSVTFPTRTITGGTTVASVSYVIVLPTTTTTTATGTVTSVNIATPTTYLSPIPVSSSNTITGTSSTNPFIHPYRTRVPTIESTLSLTGRYTQGLAAWFDAANSGTIRFSSGNLVNAWDSAGGSISSLTLVPSASNFPTLVSNAQNGLPGMRFSISAGTTGTPLGSSFNISVTQLSTLSNNNEITLFTVFNPTSTSLVQVPTSIVSSSNNQRIQQYTTGVFSYRSATTEQLINYSPRAENTTCLTTFYRRTNIMSVRNNGSFDGGSQTTIMPLVVPNTSNYSITLGGYAVSSPTVTPFAGDLYEHIIFRYALTDQAIFQIEGYLAWKWGLNTSLPTTHPYYKIRP